MFQESVLREAIESQISSGWILSRDIWFKFRDGREPPKVSPWGCVLISLNTSSGGNFMIPSGNWWSSVVEHLKVQNSWLEMFASGFDNKPISSAWMSQSSSEDLEAYQLGRRLASEYLKG